MQASITLKKEFGENYKGGKETYFHKLGEKCSLNL